MTKESNREIILAIGVLLLGEALEAGFGLGTIRYQVIAEDPIPDEPDNGEHDGQD